MAAILAASGFTASRVYSAFACYPANDLRPAKNRSNHPELNAAATFSDVVSQSR